MADQIRIMCVETSGRLGSVAVAEGGKLLLERHFTAMQAHASELLPTMASLCEEVGWRGGDIDHLYFSIGPGSFTGLRIAVTVAKSMAFAGAVKLVAVPSMEVLALNARDALEADGGELGQVGLVVDAKRRQIYTGVYDWVGDEAEVDEDEAGYARGFWRVLDACLLKPSELLEKTGRPLWLLGEGLAQHGKAFADADGVECLPEQYWSGQARHVHSCGWRRAQKGQFCSAAALEPMYLRRPEAIERWEKLHGTD
ncbi:MAG: tRNA (adenosine(37)-N6)-threonylcarbamoyltransferase complex dimerization subunit type 1 TsaB [Sedimentisphaerales bacterium]|nr:tRNA (adenosine(37)-N6)-threonylcarbamoyltransferase complex dimerization subunit type 1 TsaB [Sedimentisphaerales bacterium]